jgi:hypothetical protein
MHVAPKGITSNPKTDENSQAQTSSAVLFAGVPIALTSAGSKTSKNEQKDCSFHPTWYTGRNIYSDSTLYNKVGRLKMEAFLAGEGVNVIEKFGKGSYPRYIEKANKRVKINKGEALIDLVKVVHQRVIDRRNAGFPVGPNQAPNLGAEDWEAQISAFDEDKAHSLPAVAGAIGNAFEVSRKQELTVKTNGDSQASFTREVYQASQVKETSSPTGTASRKFLPSALVRSAPRLALGIKAHHDWSDRVFTHHLEQLRQDLKFIKNAIMSESKIAAEAVENAERVTVASDGLNDDEAAHRAQAKTAELDRLIRNSNGQVVISAEVQALVRRVIDAAIRYCEIDRRYKARDGKKAQLTKEARDTNNEFQKARSDIMQRLAADTVWDRSVRRSGLRVAHIVLEVLPARPHEVLK